MGTGLSIFLLVVGAVFVFALKVSLIGLDVPAVGVILMAAGAFGLAFALAGYVARERRRAHGGPAGEAQPYWYYHRNERRQGPLALPTSTRAGGTARTGPHLREKGTGNEQPYDHST